MKCVICERDGVVGVFVNEKLICHECWSLAHKLIGREWSG